MSEYIPPYPYRQPVEPTTWQRVKLGRRNLLGAMSEAAFNYDFEHTQILARSVFICNTPDTVQYAFSIKNESFERKSPTMRHMLKPLIGDGLFISEGDTWRKRRRIVAPIIHVSRLAQFAPVMAQTAREMRDRWSERPDGTRINVLSEMARLTAEIICRTVFGQELGEHRAREIVEGFTEFQRSVSLLDMPSVLGLPDWLPRLRRPTVYRAIRRIHGALDDIVAGYHKRNSHEQSSVIGQLIDARDAETGEPLDDDAIRNEAAVIFMAGYETTAATLAFAWFLLSQAADVEARLHDELDTVLGDRAPTLADVPKLSYTRAIVEETLRLYPPIPILGREALVDETVAGRTVPKGALLVVVPFLLHRKKSLWDKPDHFMPERFMPGGGGAPSKWAYVPFSIGPRICAGMAFGMTEAILCVAMLAQRFRLALAPGHAMEPVCRVSLRPGPGDDLPMLLHRRHAAAKAAAAPAEAAQACPFGHG